MRERYPLLFPLVLLCTGILLAGFFAPSLQLIMFLFGLGCTIFFFAAIWRKAPTSSLYYILILLLGYVLTGLRDARYQKHHYANYPTEKQIYLAELASYPVKTSKATRLEVTLIQTDKHQAITGNIYLYVPQNEDAMHFLPGDKLLFEAQLNPLTAPLNPHEFNYRNYLNLHQIYAQAYTTNFKILNQSRWRIERLATRTRNALLTSINHMHLPAEETAVASALLLGYRHLISDETTQAFSGSGAMHVLAVSGLHVGILYGIVAFLFRINRKKPQQNHTLQIIMIIAIIWGYAVLTGLSPSVNRAAVMFTLITAGHGFKRKLSTIQAIIVSALLLLAYNPNNLFEVGFQLSYLAVFGIVYLQKRIYYLVPKPKNKAVDYVWQITTVSIAAQLATFPLGIYYFHQFPLLFLVSNLVVIPAAGFIMGWGIFVLVWASIFPLPEVVALPLEWSLWFMIKVVHLVQEVPNSVWYELWLSRLGLVALTFFVFALTDAIWHKNKQALLLSAILGIFLLAENNVRAWQNSLNQKFTVYSIKNLFAAEVRHGKTSVLLADNILLSNEDAMLFHIRHNQWAGGVAQQVQIPLVGDTMFAWGHVSGNIIELDGTRILRYKSPTDSTLFGLKPALIFMAANHPKLPQKVPPNSRIVLMNGLRPKTREAWKATFTNVHDLAEGALILDSKNH